MQDHIAALTCERASCTATIEAHKNAARVRESQIRDFQRSPEYLQFLTHKNELKMHNDAAHTVSKTIKRIDSDIAAAHARIAQHLRTAECLREYRLWDVLDCTQQQWFIQNYYISTGESFADYYTGLYFVVLYTCHTSDVPLECNATYTAICEDIVKKFPKMTTLRTGCWTKLWHPNNRHTRRPTSQWAAQMYPTILARHMHKVHTFLNICRVLDIDFHEYTPYLSSSIPHTGMLCTVDILCHAVGHKLGTVRNLINDNLWYEHTDNAARIAIALTEPDCVYPPRVHYRNEPSVKYWGSAYIFEHIAHITAYTDVVSDLPMTLYADPRMWVLAQGMSPMCKIKISTHNGTHILTRSTYADVARTINTELTAQTGIGHALCQYLHILEQFDRGAITQMCMTNYRNAHIHRNIVPFIGDLIGLGFPWQCTTLDQFKFVVSHLQYVDNSCNYVNIAVRYNNCEYPYYMMNKSDIDVMYTCTDIPLQTRRNYFSNLRKYHMEWLERCKVWRGQFARLCAYVDNSAPVHIPRELLQFVVCGYCNYLRPRPLLYSATHTAITDYLADTLTVEQLCP